MKTRLFTLAISLLLLAACAHSEKKDSDMRDGDVLSLSTSLGTHFDALRVGSVEARRAVILVHGRHGVDAGLRRFAAQLAGEDYLVLAPDLFDGRAALAEDHDYDVLADIDPLWVASDVEAAVRYLNKPPRKLALIAWDRNADQAMDLATRYVDTVAAVILVNDVPALNVAQAQALKAAVMTIVADDHSDELNGRLARFQNVMSEGHSPLKIIRYQGATDALNPQSLVTGKAGSVATEVNSFLKTYL